MFSPKYLVFPFVSSSSWFATQTIFSGFPYNSGISWYFIKVPYTFSPAVPSTHQFEVFTSYIYSSVSQSGSKPPLRPGFLGFSPRNFSISRTRPSPNKVVHCPLFFCPIISLPHFFSSFLKFSFCCPFVIPSFLTTSSGFFKAHSTRSFKVVFEPPAPASVPLLIITNCVFSSVAFNSLIFV